VVSPSNHADFAITPTPRIAANAEVFAHHDSRQDQDWLVSWHPAGEPPSSGKRHGSEAVCVLPDGNVVMISEDHGSSWGLPGGRPEGDEDWRQTLDREVLEEACAVVNDATLLGYARSECIRGHEQGLVLVRSFWRATVTLCDWDPQHEITDRKVVSATDALANTETQDLHPISRRIFREALGEPIDA
jgi:ADP-ribose pyrophosphatase YjhB (NUDIX family)